MKLLDGKTVVMTGGGGGLGRCYGAAFARAGAAVAVCDLDLASAQATSKAITAAGERSIALQCDVTKAAAFEDVFERTEAELGPIDVLVNLAGVYPKNVLVDLTEAEWDAVIAVNLKSVFLGSRAAIRRMLSRKRGVVLSAASGTALRGVPSGSAYVASKAAIIGFTRAVGVELIGTGVRINCFAPGPTDTALWREGKTQDDVKRVVAAGNVFQPDDFSNVVVFLASDQSAPLNGEFINRDLYRR
jgi:NAD(P)-dependent dehydrogenase (short-subunit alcohol dehydrogenase family)